MGLCVVLGVLISEVYSSGILVGTAYLGDTHRQGERHFWTVGLLMEPQNSMPWDGTEPKNTSAILE